MSYQKLSHEIEPGEVIEYETSSGTHRAEFVREEITEMDGAIIVIRARRVDNGNFIALRYVRGRPITLIPAEPL